MKARFGVYAIPVVLAVAAFAVLADGAAAFPGNLGERIARATKAAVNDAMREAERASERARAEVPDPAAGGAVLRLEGTEGTGFSGNCTVGDEEREVSGRVPESFTFDLAGADTLECEVRKEDAEGTLEVLFAAGDDRVVQRMTGEGGTARIVYRDGGVSSSMNSSSRAASQVTTNASSSVVSTSSTTE